jgi:GNAT superfamily N-acetyltransferase
MQTFDFRKLSLDQVRELVSWAEKEGWNPGPQDADLFYLADPDGFYGYFKDDELIGGGSLVSYAGEFGFMGLYIMKPEYRSQGIGRLLWNQRKNTLLSRLKPQAAIGMDGVVAMQPFYHRGGFELAFTDERHENIGKIYSQHPAVSPITNDDLAAVLDFDLHCFGFDRKQFMQAWLFQSEGQSFKFTNEKGLQGFAVVRQVKEGYKIGPLFAENEAVAQALYERCLTAVVGEKVYLDIPLCNPLAVALTQKYQTKAMFECGRMYYGTAPLLPLHKVFGITTFELG